MSTRLTSSVESMPPVASIPVPTVSTDNSPVGIAYQSLIADRELVSSAISLVQAVAMRHLTLEELRTIEPDGMLSTSQDRLEARENLSLRAEERFNRFYEAFGLRVTSLGVDRNTPDFAVFAAAVLQLLPALPALLIQENQGIRAATIQLKVASTIQRFNGRIFEDMVDTFARQPLRFITIDSFQQKANVISAFFQNIEMVDIQMFMRQAIKGHHGTIGTEGIIDPSAHSALKQQIIAQLTEEKAALEAELTVMRGPNGLDGTYNAAAERVANAQGECAAALSAYLAMAMESIGARDFAREICRQKRDALTLAQVQLNDFQVRFNEIEQFTGPDLTGGRLFEINRNLDPVHLDVQAARIQEIIANLATERDALERELNEMRGPNGFDGTYNAAVERLGTAERESRGAAEAFERAAIELLDPDGNRWQGDPDGPYRYCRRGHSTPVDGPYCTYIERGAACMAAREELNAIRARFNVIAQYTGDQLTGGRLFEINGLLDNPIHFAGQAREQTVRIADFYQELNLDVTQDNKVVRFNALNAILTD